MAPGVRATLCGIGRAVVVRFRRQPLAQPPLRLGALEGKDRAPVRAAVRLPDRGVGIHRVVGDEGVGAVVVALGGVDRLRAADLLRGLPEEAELPLDAVLLHRRLRGQEPGQRADPQHGVRVGVPGRVRVQTLARRLVRHRLLRVAGNGVVLGVGADDRAARSPGGEEGGRHLAAALFDVEPFVAQQVDVGLRGTVLPPRRFGVSPDLQIEVGEPLPVLVDPVVRKLLRLREARHCPIFLSR